MTEPFETYDDQRARDRQELLDSRIAQAEHDRDQARAELAKVKRDIGWMMGQGLIADYVMQSDTIPAGTGHILVEDEQDTARLRWLNEQGRVSLGNGRFVVSFPHGIGVENQEIPEPYNIRHLIDLCRKFVPST